MALAIKFGEGQCQEGCGGEVAKGRRFLQGHDARLKGQLYAAIRAGETVTVNGKSTDPAAVVKSQGWPAPVAKAPRKARAKKSTAKAKPAAKRTTARKPRAKKS